MATAANSGYVRSARAAVVAAILATLAAPVRGETAPPRPAPVKAAALPDRDAWRLGDGTFLSPVTGRTWRAPQEKSGEPSGTAYAEDDRLAGQRRSAFYAPSPEVTGPGRVDQVTGGLCDGVTATGVSVEPAQVVVDRGGRVFWVDLGARAHLKAGPYVRTIDPDGTVRTLGTVDGPLEGRLARSSGSSEPLVRIAPDDHGGVYYSHSDLHRFVGPGWSAYTGDDQPSSTVIGHLDARGHASWVAGMPPSDAPLDGSFDVARFQYVTAMATDHQGRLYVADGPVPFASSTRANASPTQRTVDPTTPGASMPTGGGTLLRVVDLDARTVTRIGGVRGEGKDLDPKGTTTPVDGVHFGFVSSVAIGDDGVLRLLNRDDGVAQVVAVNTTRSRRTAHGVAIPAGHAVSVAGGEQGFADGPGRDARFDFRIADLWFYGAIATAADGDAYVADTVNNRLRRVDARGRVTTVTDRLSFPMGVAVDPRGGVVVSDWHDALVRRVLPGGRVETVAGNGLAGRCDDLRNDGTFLRGGAVLSPHDTAADSKGNVYVADISLGVVQRIAPDGTTSVVAGTPHDCRSGSPAYQGIPTCPFVQPKGDGGAPERAVLQAPSYLAVDAYDNLYVSDGTGVRYVNLSDRALRPQDVPVAPHTIATVYSAQAVIHRVLPPELTVNDQTFTAGVPYEELVGLTGIAVDKANTLYVADLNARRVVSITYCGVLTPVAGSGAFAQVGGAGDGGPAIAAPVSPVGVALDEQRRLLFVSSTSEQRVRVVNVGLSPVQVNGATLLPGVITTFLGGGRCVGTQQPPLVPACSFGDGLLATAAAVTAPYDVAAAPGGRVYVGDAGANTIRLVEPDGDVETLAGVTPDYVGYLPEAYGAGGYCGNGGVAFRACFGGITGLSLEAGGDLVVSEMMSGVVRRISSVASAPVRPPGLVEPPRGAGWTFGSPVLLEAPSDVDVRDPDIAIARDGTGYVLARQTTQSQNAAGCALWRYTVSRTARADIAVALPEPDGLGPIPGLDRGVGRSCALGVTREPSGSVLPPLGDAVRLGFASTAILPDDPLTGGVVESAITGASRSGGQDFVRSPAGVLGASLNVRVPRIGVEDGQTTFYLAYCCNGTNATTQAAGIAVATSVGGIQYQPAGVIEFDKARFQGAPVSERQFVGTPIVRGDRVLVPFYAIACGVPTPRCTSTSPRVMEGWVAESTDKGATFTKHGPLFSYECELPDTDDTVAYCTGHHGVPQLAMDKAGALAYAWDEGRHVYLRTSRDGATWTPAKRLDTGVSVASYPALVAGEGGRFGVAFLGSARPVPSAMAADAEWYLFLSVTTDGGRTFAQSLATEAPVFTGPLCQYQGACIGGGQWESVVGNWFHATVNPVDGRIVVASPAGAARYGRTSGGRVIVVRQCSGPALVGNAAASPCAPAAKPAPHRPAALSTARNAPLAVLGCEPPAPQPAHKPAPRPPRPTEGPPLSDQRHDHAPPAAIALPGAVAGAAPPPLAQPGNAPQPQAQPEANAQHVANPLTGVATDEQERTEVTEEYAMTKREEDPPLVPWAVAFGMFAAATYTVRARTARGEARVR